MKKLRKIVVLFTAALLFVLPIFGSTISAQAAEPVTYYVKYVDSVDAWRFQTGSWQDNNYHRDMSYLPLEIKDGDHLVIDGPKDIKLSVDVNLSSLTVVNSTLAVISAKSYENVYTLNGTTSAISGDVKNAYVYEKFVANFNDDVTNLYMISQEGPIGTLAVVGSVSYMKVSTLKTEITMAEYYNFKENTLRVTDGALKTAEADFSRTAPAAAPTPAAPSTSTTTPSGEYDEVPKTGDLTVSPLWFLGLAAICMVGHYKLKRS